MIAGYHHDVTMSAYLADPCEAPSLSTKTVATLTNRTAMHAHAEHPRLGGKRSDNNTRADMGSAVHAGIHGGSPVVFCGEVELRSGKRKGERFIAEDWATEDAKAFRDAAREEGKIPLLECDRFNYEGAVSAGLKALSAYKCESQETTMLWQLDNGVWCRGRADFLGEHPQLGLVDIDTKTCDDADPFSWPIRNVRANALDIQAGLRSIGHAKLDVPRTMLWMLIEIEAPFAVSFVGVDETTLALARRKILHAADIWERCLRTNEWPGYSDAPVWASANTYAELELDARGVKP